mmetsp:Transcript_29865/g.83450  ORF Transcript_29865/g.83450 Transcript_29865/m.83450 type:complete len:103 (+) Transcript_29865:91-399(+)|eukprot:CAMPEP_0119129534 /NCGR_PEP_ID=MMETSP1310-20130426/7244_1 /TAXON_ID=464262 /ORGANISM="Genus nov. species nov., Strain RCC2339" /LENGTH=102 /DNA_ID=CAMNT_0007119961 /DNA_START=87 /DNA_END=395 /DNA_ORIENTATION=-
MSYIRAKRKQTTAFLYVEPGDKISSVKDQIANLKLDDGPSSGSGIRLYSSDEKTALEDGQTIDEAKLESNAVVYFVFKKSGSEDWEKIDVQAPAPAKDGDDK